MAIHNQTRSDMRIISLIAGNWMPELIAADPDILFVSPCGFDIKRTQEEMYKLKAVCNKRVVIADGNQFRSQTQSLDRILNP